MNHYDVIVMGLRPATAAGAGPLSEKCRKKSITRDKRRGNESGPDAERLG
jgi:hypothetical protein